METHATKLPFYRLFEVGSSTSLRNSLKSFCCRFEILPPALLEALNAELTTVLYYFDIAITNWLILAASVIRIGKRLVEVGKSVATSFDKVKVIKLEDMFVVLFNDKTEILDLTFNLLRN